MSTRKPATVYPDTLPLREARERYFAENGFRAEDYTASTFKVGFFGFVLKFPNTPGRKRVIPFHDLHHVLTGFATDWIGEAEIGAWELRAGCTTFEAYFLNGSGVVIGLFLSPQRVWRAFRAAKGHRTLYRDGASYEQLLQMTVGDVRKKIGIPAHGISA
jgi:hypothetical protein